MSYAIVLGLIKLILYVYDKKVMVDRRGDRGRLKTRNVEAGATIENEEVLWKKMVQ